MTSRALLASGILLIAAAPTVLAQTHVSEPKAVSGEVLQHGKTSQDWYQFDILLFSQKHHSTETELPPPVTDHEYPYNAVTLYTREQLTVPKENLPQPVVETPESTIPESITPELATSGTAVPAELLGEPTPAATPVLAEQQASFDYYEDNNTVEASASPPLLTEQMTDRIPDLARDPFVLLPESMSALSSQAKILRRSKDYRLLWQASFRMPVSKGGEPIPIRITAGQKLGRNHQVEGVITFSQKRFLHADTDLWINTMNPVYPLEQVVAGSPVLTHLEDSSNRSGATEISDDIPFWPVDTHFYTKNMLMKSSQRLQIGKLNFIDHPNLGILIKASSYQLPDVSE